MSFLQQVLPVSDGYLPYWQLFVASLATLNGIQNLFSSTLTKKIYTRLPHQITPLQSRAFGIWTLVAAVVRFHAAYYISSKPVYNMAMWSYFLAFAHFFTEVFVFRSAGINGGTISPFIVSSASLYWMYTQYNYYVTA